MKPTNILTLTLLLSAAFAQAETVAKSERYELKRRSEISLNREARSPFWPIGWQRPKDAPQQPQRVQEGTLVKQIVVEPPKLQLSSDSFIVSSVLLGHPSIAVINGRSFEEGQYLPVIADDQQRVKVKVRQIREQGVWLQLDNQPPVLVPMRRGQRLQPKVSPQIGQPQDWSIKLIRQ